MLLNISSLLAQKSIQLENKIFDIFLLMSVIVKCYVLLIKIILNELRIENPINFFERRSNFAFISFIFIFFFIILFNIKYINIYYHSFKYYNVCFIFFI
jgi:hypothetical protein